MNINIIAAAPAKVDLSAGWTKVIAALESGWSGLLTALTFVGILLIVWALVKWAWDRRRGGGMQGSGPMWGALIPGFILVAPKILIPFLLNLFDIVANLVLRLIASATGA
ncbi:hypothetical protein LG293_16435 (plasmid) [Citricoccus nitrophenolicus]